MAAHRGSRCSRELALGGQGLAQNSAAPSRTRAQEPTPEGAAVWGAAADLCPAWPPHRAWQQVLLQRDAALGPSHPLSPPRKDGTDDGHVWIAAG